MTKIQATQMLGIDGLPHSYLSEDGAMGVWPYLQAIAEGDVANHIAWTKIGYTPNCNSVESDVWSYGATQPVYIYPIAAAGMEILSSDNTQDIGTVIKGDATGNTVQSDAGGSTTTLLDADVDFTAATAVAAGDCIILDPHGTTPEYGFVTTVAAHTLTISNGFSSGGTGTSRYYAVIDKSAHTGAQIVGFDYLDGSHAEKKELVVLNGTTVVPTVNTNIYRINSFRVLFAGSTEKSIGNLSIRATADTPVYSYILAGFTRARNIAYTVPTGKTLYVTSYVAGFGVSAASAKNVYARIFTKANIDPTTKFNTGSLFYPFSEVMMQNTTVVIPLEIPTKLPSKTDIRIGCISYVDAGACNVILRGWIETN